MIIKAICLNCGKEVEGELLKDELGPHMICPECGASFDVAEKKMITDYDIRYTRKDGTFGAYSGRDDDGETFARRAFSCEVAKCLSLGYEFTAQVRRGYK